MAIDFVIVGGGIGGAVLANLLGSRGKRVLVLEKGWTPAPQNRPEILWPPTVAVLWTLIPESLPSRWMVPIQGGEVKCRKQTLLRFGPEVFQEAGVQPYSTEHTRQILLEQAPCDYQRGVEVLGVLVKEERVVGVRTRDTATGAEREVLATWTVGDDGAHSVIRRSCGLSMKLNRFPVELLGFSFDWPAALPAGEVRIWINEHRVRTGVLGMPVAPLPQGRGTGLIPVWPEVLQTEGYLRHALRDLAEQDPTLQELLGKRPYPEGFTHFKVAWGRSPRFGVPGALLMGDAAHPVTPAGGQGANLSVADALVIADLALARPGDLLAEYARRRRPAALRSLAISRSAWRFASLPRMVLNLGLLLLPWAVRWGNARPERFGRLLRTAAEAFV